MSSIQARLPIILLTISAALLSVLAGMTMWRIYEARNAPTLQSLIVLPEARSIADFELIDQSGSTFNIENMKGNWSLIFFGFTSCPDICPNTLYQLQQARAMMKAEMQQQDLPIIYLISVDPARDKPKKLAEYLSYFDPSFRGLTGEEAQLRALAFQLGITYFIEPHEKTNLNIMLTIAHPFFC